MAVEIVIVNASPVLTDAEVQIIVPALQHVDDTMLRPAWGFEPAVYSFMPLGQLPAADDIRWPIYLNRHSTDPGALGWHDDQGRPFGRVFVGDCLRYGISWTVDASHEAFEMRGNPFIKEFVKLVDGRTTVRELCDAVEDDALAIEVGGVKISDFVLPAYFARDEVGPYDYGGHLAGPCPALTAGGYQSLLVNGVWTQLTAMLLGGPPSYRSARYHHGDRLPPAMPALP